MTVDRFHQRVNDYDAELRSLARDQSLVTFKSPEWYEIQRDMDAIVAAKREFQGDIPNLRQTDRAVTLRLLAVLIGAGVGVLVLVYFGVISPWWLLLDLPLAGLAYGVLAAER